jgi:hypothetical protein
MPIYTYEHPETGERVDIVQTMSEDHSYTDENGLKWNRVFSIPNASTDSQIDPNNPQAFLDATRNKKGSMGDLLDKSKELSEKRADKNGGSDPIKDKFFKEYSDSRKGAKHPEQKKKYESKRIKVDY